MADGKTIEIKIAATGGDQAASELAKPKQAIESLIVSEDSLAKKRAQFLTAAQAEVAEVDRLVAGAKKLEVAQNSLAESKATVTKKGVQMGTGMQNVGYQVQDLAVQIGSGTSAFRALGQQLPQLLSGFGPMGIALGTVSAVALPLAGVLFNLGDSAKSAGDEAAEAADKLERLQETRAKKAAEESAQDYRQFVSALDDETIAYKRQNDEIQRTIDLLQAKRRAQAEVDSADAALALAKIDASDAPEEEKIRARAKIKEDLERKQFENRKAESGDRVNAAFNKAAGATGDATLKASEVDATKQRLAEQEAEAASLKGKIIAADQAAARLPDLDKKIQENSAPVPFLPGQGDLSAKLEAQRQSELAKLQAERDQVANAAGGANDGDRRRLEELRGKDGISGDNKELAKSIEALTKAAEALQETARKAQGDYQGVREVETAKLGGDFEATKRRLETNQITSDSSAGKSAREAQKKRDDDADQARQKAATDSGKNAREAGSTARSAEGLIPKGASDKFRKDFQKVSDGLQNGDQGGEVAKMLSMIESLANAVEKKGTDKELSRRLDIMEQRIRNLGK